jgi:hypothetical protein
VLVVVTVVQLPVQVQGLQVVQVLDQQVPRFPKVLVQAPMLGRTLGPVQQDQVPGPVQDQAQGPVQDLKVDKNTTDMCAHVTLKT